MKDFKHSIRNLKYGKANNGGIFRYEDLEWKPAYLRPEVRYGLDDSLRRKSKKSETPVSVKTVEETKEEVILSPGKKTTKITDCGYDMLSCCYTGIPAEYDFELSALVRVERFLADGPPVYQEGFGLFIRDNMTLEHSTGYPYANMALAGGYLGGTNFYVRTGVTKSDHEDIQNYSLKGRASEKERFAVEEPRTFRIRIRLSDREISAEMSDDDGTDMFAPETAADDANTCLSDGFSRKGTIYSIPVGKDIFLERDKRNIYIGFLAAGNTRIAIIKDSVSITLTPGGSGSKKEIYVSPDGKAQAAGDIEHPMDLAAAVSLAGAGVIKLLPGRYCPDSDLVLGKRLADGGHPCIVAGEPGKGKDTVIDFGGKEHALKITGDYWTLENITVANGMGIQISGSHNRLKGCISRGNRETGILIRHPDNNAKRQDWPEYNLIEDCISCMNIDDSECNADGFACKVTAGRGNEFIRCISFLNSDDGFDLFAKNRATGKVRLKDCVSCLNGYRITSGGDLLQTKGHGTGFKLGGSGIRVRHLVRDCTAQGNKDCGFTSNSNPSMILVNCRSLYNQKGNLRFYYSGARVIPEKIIIEFTEKKDPDFDQAKLCRDLLAKYDIETI